MSFPHWTEVERETYLELLEYRIDRIAITLHEGNTDQVGRNAWSGMIDELQKAVTSFINEKNRLFSQTAWVNQDKIKAYKERIQKLQNQLGLPDENVTEIQKLINVYKCDVEKLEDDEFRKASDQFRKKSPDFQLPGLPEIIVTKTFNNSYDITYGYVSTNVDKNEWNQLFSAVHKLDKPGEERIRLMAQQPIERADLEKLNVANASLNSKNTVRTISSCMEMPNWAGCGMTPFCSMPNIKRTADIAVCVMSQYSQDSINYPVFIGEVLGKKEAGSSNEQRYEGYTAVLQSLVFAPRAYYWEIRMNTPELFILERNPAKGQIDVSRNAYALTSIRRGTGKPIGVTQMLKDISHAFFDTLINLRPIAEHSASCLYAANYREFLSCALEGGRDRNIQIHCWHIFSPRAQNWDDDNPPPAWHANDAEDPEKPHREWKEYSHRVAIDVEGCAIPVDEESFKYQNLDEAFYEFMPPIRAVTDEDSNPLDPTEENLDTSIRLYPQLAVQETLRYLETFVERAANHELAIFGQNFSKTVAEMTFSGHAVGQEDLEEAEKEQELGIGDEDRPLIHRFVDFDPSTTAESIVAPAQESLICAELINDKVIIRGPYGKPFEGGFEILRNGDLIYMQNVSQPGRFEGFEGLAKIMIDKSLWKFLHFVADLYGDKNARSDMGSTSGDTGDGGGGGDNGGSGDGWRSTRVFTSTPAPGAPRLHISRHSTIPLQTPRRVTPAATPAAAPKVPEVTPSTSQTPQLQADAPSTSRIEVIINCHITRPLRGLPITEPITEQLPSLPGSGKFNDIVSLL